MIPGRPSGGYSPWLPSWATGSFGRWREADVTFGWRFTGRLVVRQRSRAIAVALLLLGVVGCSAIVKNDQHRVFSKAAFGSDRFALVRDYNIHYVEAGEGQPLLLIPGAFTTYRTWNRVLPELSRH